MFDVIIAASGNSVRFGGKKNKLSVNTGGYSVLEGSVRPFLTVEGLERVIIAASEAVFGEAREIAKRLSEKITVIKGGSCRTQTVRNALEYVSAEYVLIHDGARPFVGGRLIKSVLDGTAKKGACVPLSPLEDSIARVKPAYASLDRNDYRAVQTPQGFKTSLIKKAYASAAGEFTDDVSVYLTLFDKIAEVESDKSNRKITTESDVLLPCCRVGTGFDTHLFAEGRRFVLGGVEIPYHKGLLGHSDADVLLHAISDALLSASGRRDIGFYFPDSDDRYLNADSMKLLGEVFGMLQSDGYAVNNIAATVLAEKPRLSPYIPSMVERIAAALKVNADAVSILATTTEGAGEIGRGEAVSAIAYVSIIKQNQ